MSETNSVECRRDVISTKKIFSLFLGPHERLPFEVSWIKKFDFRTPFSQAFYFTHLKGGGGNRKNFLV